MKMYRTSSAVLITLFIVIGFITFLTAAEKIAYIAYVEGNVEVQSAPQKVWKKAEVGMRVNIGDSIRTARRSKADIILDKEKKHSIRIEPKTLLVLNSTSPGQINKLDLSAGKVYADVEKMLAGMSFEVATPSSVAGVRGSAGSVESFRDRDIVSTYKDEMYVQTFDAQHNLISEITVPENFKVEAERFGAVGQLMELTSVERAQGEAVREDLSTRVEAPTPAAPEPKKEEEAAGVEATEIQQAQQAVEMTTEASGDTKQQAEERATEEAIPETREEERGTGCGG